MLEKKPLIVSTYEQETAVAPYRLVTAGTDANEVIEATGTGSVILGLSDETASDTVDDEVSIVMLGIALCQILAGSASRADAITGTTDGKGLATTTDNHHCVGYLLKATTVANELAPILVNPFMYGTI